MTDTRYWTSAPDRIVRGSMGLCHLTVAQPPFTVDARSLPANDSDQAHLFVESFDGIEEVLEDLGPRSVQTPLPSSVRADLDIVHAAVWGGMRAISTPVFADDGNGNPLLAEAERMRERFPTARIVGHVTYYGGMEHTETVVMLPDGAMFHASGWPDAEPFVVLGAPHAVIASLGLRSWMLTAADIDMDQPLHEIEWASLAGLALGHSDPWGWEEMQTTAFRVQHSDLSVCSMEGLYFI
ncbi:DUF6333 family protein [Streptomyces chattanoogensis]|nr:DUF6333 family protein [Streptomyces chattanoogensis]